MTNQERRAALAEARQKAVLYAGLADRLYDNRAEDGPEVNLAVMWAHVADALKDGDPAHDSVTTLPGDLDFGIVTR